MKHRYSVEMFKIWDGEEKPRWGTDIRIYDVKKDLNDFDLKDVPGLRRNATYFYWEHSKKKPHMGYYGEGTKMSLAAALIPFL